MARDLSTIPVWEQWVLGGPTAVAGTAGYHASTAATQLAAQAGGASSAVVDGLRADASSVVSEVHAQEDYTTTWLRWGTIALVAFVILVLVIVGAWFFAPARGLLGAFSR